MQTPLLLIGYKYELKSMQNKLIFVLNSDNGKITTGFRKSLPVHFSHCVSSHSFGRNGAVRYI